MEKFYCECCDFYSASCAKFTKHLESKTHKKQSNNILLSLDISDYKKMVYQCKYCQTHFFARSTHWRHQKSCGDDSKISNNNCNPVVANNLDFMSFMMAQAQLFKAEMEKNNGVALMTANSQLPKNDSEKINEIIAENKFLKNEIEKKDKIIESAMNLANTNATVALETTHVTNKSMNMLHYANRHILEGKPLKKLKKKDAYLLIGYDNPLEDIPYEEYEKHVKICVSNYNGKNFVEYVGDMIGSHYKPKKITETNILTTDVSRISMLVLQQVDKDINVNEKEWINDKSGKRFISMILSPLLNAFKESINNFISLANKKVFPNMEQQEQMLCLLTNCQKLIRDIDKNTFTQPILKYVAPLFHFDALKLHNESEEDEKIKPKNKKPKNKQ